MNREERADKLVKSIFLGIGGLIIGGLGLYVVSTEYLFEEHLVSGPFACILGFSMIIKALS